MTCFSVIGLKDIVFQGCPLVAFLQNLANQFLNNGNRFLSCICKLYMFYFEIKKLNIIELYGGVIYSNIWNHYTQISI